MYVFVYGAGTDESLVVPSTACCPDVSYTFLLGPSQRVLRILYSLSVAAITL